MICRAISDYFLAYTRAGGVVKYFIRWTVVDHYQAFTQAGGVVKCLSRRAYFGFG